MSLHINFEPHSWYKGFAIKHNPETKEQYNGWIWIAYTDNGMTYMVDTLEANTLKELKQLITEYHRRETERVERLYR